MPEQDRPVEIDKLVPARLRETLEERYLHPIEQAMKLEVLAHDPTFLADPVNHPALFADHGVIHVRDVAASLLSIAATANGVLLARRPPERQAFVAAYGLLATYLHDVGMHDQTRAGRRLHPIYAAHLVFGSDFDEVVEDLLAFDGPIRRRLLDVQAAAPLAVPLDLVLRELLSLTLAHSKSTVPAPLLDNRVAFRRLAQQAVLTDLETHRATGGLPGPGDPQPLALTANTRRYASAADAVLRVARVRRARTAQPGGRRRRRAPGAPGR